MVYGVISTVSCEVDSSVTKIYLKCKRDDNLSLVDHVIYDKQKNYYGGQLTRHTLLKTPNAREERILTSR